MPNVNDDDQESLLFADESEWMDEDPDEDEAPTYKIVRFYQDSRIERETVETGLTLDEAQERCSDPETSSTTATNPEAMARTERCGAWFEGYCEE
jgi:hypothetical protein